MTSGKGGVPPETIQQIRERVDLVDLISTYVSLTKAGQNFKGLCPFHSEKSPSFSVNPTNQYFHCFGCQVGGDAFTFLMKQEGMDFMEALRELSQRTGVALPDRRQSVSRTTARVIPTAILQDLPPCGFLVSPEPSEGPGRRGRQSVFGKAGKSPLNPGPRFN